MAVYLMNGQSENNYSGTASLQNTDHSMPHGYSPTHKKTITPFSTAGRRDIYAKQLKMLIIKIKRRVCLTESVARLTNHSLMASVCQADRRCWKTE